MIKTVTIGDEAFQIRALTRAEIRKLEPFGFSFLACVPTYETANQAQDAVFDLVLVKSEKKKLEQLPNREVTRLWSEILKETYGAPDEEKNLSGTSDGSQTGNG